MLISTWLKSFRNRLQPHPRRTSRRTPDQAARNLEHLEARHLLAAPQLIDVQDEGGRVIVEDSEIGNSPSELVVDFSTAPDLDPATFGAFTLERAGQDGAFDGIDVQVPIISITPGIANPNEVVLTLGQSLPSDLYRINIPGTLANTAAETFNGGVDDTFGFSIQLPPPSLVAVRPDAGTFFTEDSQPIVLNVAPRELTLQFNPGQVIDPLTINTETVRVQRAGQDGSFAENNEEFIGIGYVGIGDVPEEVVVRFAENLPDDDYRILLSGTGLNRIASVSGEILNNGQDSEFPFELELGARIIAIDPQPVTRDPNTGVISQNRRQIVLYFNDDELNATSAATEEFYQLIFTNDTISNADDNPATPGLAVNPDTAAYDSVANTVTLTFLTDIDQIAGAGTYRLRIGTNEAIPLPPVATSFGPTQDLGDSFDAATLGQLGDLTPAVSRSQIISSAIEPVAYPFDFPGAQDEPGHREIEIETHLNGGADAQPGTTQVDFNFQSNYGSDPSGNILINTITEAQKQRAREVFEYYSTILGIDVRETTDLGLTIATGDLRALDPTVPTGPGGVTGIAGGGVAIMDQAEVWDDSAGANWFQTAMHEIGHLLSIGHAADLPPITVNSGDGFGNTNPGAYNGLSENVFPGDHDIVHGLHLHRADSNDIDLYRFNVTATGLFTAEVMAERLLDSSQLDSQLRLFRQNLDGTRTLIAQNDDYFSEDSFVEVSLTAGTYFIGVSSTGNDKYDPSVPGTGFGGTSQGAYDLRVNFRPDVTNPANVLVDTTNTPFDGDSDGISGGIYNFWFRATASGDTLFVDKEAADKTTAGRANDGSAGSPFLEIDQALAAATPGQTVRIVGNGGDVANGADGDITTIADNTPYQIGLNNSGGALPDGQTFVVPKGVTVMIDAGAIIKLRSEAIGVGSTTGGVDKSGGALQILGTPDNQVILTSWLDETVGTDTTPTPTFAQPGNWGGIAIRNAVDEAEGRFSYRREGIFLNYIGNSSIQYGGGNVIIDGVLRPVNPIHVTLAQPTIVHNMIMDSVDSAISADPDSFEEITFHAPRYSFGEAAFTNDFTRVGPELYWNTLIHNSTNGLFVRVQTLPGDPISRLTVPGRFDDTDIVHVIAQNLEIQGTPGGPILDETGPDSSLVVLTPAVVSGNSLGAGSYNYRLVYVDSSGFESPTSLVTATNTVAGAANTIRLTALPAAPPEYVGRRLYRSDATGSGTYMLAAQLGRSETTYTDDGTTFDKVLDTSITERNRPNYDAQLSVAPGVVVKLEGARIESEVGAQFIAEGLAGQEIIFTSRLDDRFGAGGTFDTNDDGDLVSALRSFVDDNFESGNFDSAIWNSTATTAAIDASGLSETSGSQSAHLAPADVIQTTTVNLNGEPAVELQYAWQRTGGGSSPDGNLFVQYRNNSGTWVTLESQPAAGVDMTDFELSVVSLPAAAIHFNSAFRIAFGNPNSPVVPTTGDWFVDDFRVVESRQNVLPSPGNWGGIYVGHLGAASIDQALITFGGGVIPVENDFAGFNAVEIHQAKARIRNTVFEQNATGIGGSAPNSRYGLFSNGSATIFVRGAQPVILNNEFRDNTGPVISINANALNSTVVADPGRSTGFAQRNTRIIDNQGPLVENNRMGGNGLNAMVVRPATLTTQSVWDDADVVHVLQGEILVPDLHTFGGLRLESSSTSSLVVKLQGSTAGFTANGYPLDMDDRLGGSVQIIGQPGQPVVLTSLSDDDVGAGFDLRGFPLRDTNNDGPSTGSAGDWRSVRIAEYASDRNVAVIVENEPADSNSPDVNKSIATSEVIGLLAGNVKSGDENLRLGFEIHGVIDSKSDQDIYSFEAEAGTPVWLDIDRSSVGLDTVIELLDSNGDILAQSDNSLDELNGVYNIFTTGGTNAQPLNYSRFDDDLYTLNPADAGMRVVLPGAVGVTQSYFVRVRSSNLNASFTPTVLLSDDFETGAFDPAKWASVSGATIDGVGLNKPSGVLSARLNNDPTGDQIDSVTVDLSAETDVQLNYSFQRTGGGDSTENGEDLVISFRNGAGTWIELERQLGAGVDMNTFQSSTIDLPASALHANFAFRIETSSVAGGTTDDWFVDDVELASLPAVNRKTLNDKASVADGLTTGVYQLQVRLQSIDEFPGSQVTGASIRYATNGVEVFGQPIHSLITGEASEGVTVLPNVLNTDRAAISISGNLTDPNGQEVDLYRFEVFYDVTQQIAGDGDDAAHVPVIFDLDYADGFSRANTTIAVFNSDDELILIGRDSNISDDQAKPLGDNLADVDDITRGSVGKADPFIGPAELISGEYTLAVFSNDQVPAVISQYFSANSGSPLVRLEPLNSTTRIAEERFDPSFTILDPDTLEIRDIEFSVTSATPAVTDLFTVGFNGLDPKHVVPFNLGDVSLFVSVDGGTKNGDRTAVYTVDPFTGVEETVLGGFSRLVGDIAMRGDGNLHAFTTYAAGVTTNPNNLTDAALGNYLQINTGTAEATQVGDDGVTTLLVEGTSSPVHNVGTQYLAMTYSGTSNGNNLADLWAIGNRSTLSNKTNQAGSVRAEYVSNILYNLNIASGTVDGLGGNRRTDITFGGRDGAGTTQVEHGYVDTTFVNGGLQGLVTGMVTLDGGNSFYVVDDAGGLYLVNTFGFGSSAVDPRSPNPAVSFSPGLSTTFLRNIGADATGVGGLNLNFQGLALGPENVENGLFSQTLFGITDDGEMYAFDTTGDLQPVFVDGQTSVSTGLFNVNGLDFGTLDYNLWHVTNRRGGATAADDGHGVDVPPFDNSVTPETGGSSLYFGFEGGGNTPDPNFGGNSQSGNKNTGAGNTISNAVLNNVDFPGGAHGSVVSNVFSLEGYSTNDKPTLYFSYFLETENQNFNPGTDPDDLMRDSFRVHVQDESGQWRLLSTNNSHHVYDEFDEFDIGFNEVSSDGLSNNPSLQTFPDVVETFDNTNGWRQARIDLSNYAGMSDLKLRFDFSTAGSMNVGDITTTGSELFATPAFELTDGQTITLSNVDEFGFEISQTTFEFDLGAHLTLPSGAAAIGQSFTVVGPDYSETFTFTDAPVQPTDIPAFASDSAAALAQRANDFVNAYFQGIRIQVPDGGSLQNESFRFRTEIFTYTDTPTRPQDILAEFGDTPQTIAARTVQTVNLVLGAGAAFANGDEIDLYGGTTIEFGGSLDINSQFSLEGESFTVNQQTFTFTSNPLLATDIDTSGIGVTTSVLATRAVAVINSVLGPGTASVFTDAPDRISVPNIASVDDRFFTGGTMFLTDVADPSDYQWESFTVFGVTFNFTDTPTRINDILASPGESAATLAMRARMAIDNIFGAGTTLPEDLAAPERVAIPDLPLFFDGFQQGSTIVVQNVPDLVLYEFELFGQTFRYTDDPSLTGDILARPGDSPIAVAAETVRIINNLFGTGTAFQDLERVNIPDLSSPFDGIFQGSRLNFGSTTPTNVEGDSFTVFGTTFTFTTSPSFSFFLPDNAVEIDYTGVTTPQGFAQLAAQEINLKLASDGLAPRANIVVDTPGELVGIDFDPVASSPNNWNHSDNDGSADFVMTDLMDELGNPTQIDLNVFYGNGSGPGAIPNTPNAVDIPTHTNALTNIEGALSDETQLVFVFDDLTPGTEYEIYLFGGDSTTSGSQDVQVLGAGSQFFTQSWVNQMYVNDQVSSSANLDTFTITETANASGQITIIVNETGVADTVVIPALGIKKIANAPVEIELAGVVTNYLGTSFEIDGPDAAAVNGDTVTINGFRFTYVGGAPGNFQEIQTDNSEFITADNTVVVVNDFYQNSFFFTNFLPIFESGTRVNIPDDPEISYTDSGPNGSLVVSDYPRLEMGFGDPVAGDVLTVSGFDFTFVDTTTPAIDEIGAAVPGFWQASDIVAAMNRFFGNNTTIIGGFNQVYFFIQPSFFGPVLTYNDSGDGGLTIIDDGTGGNPFFFTQIAQPLGALLEIDLPGTPITSDNQGTPFTHDAAFGLTGTPIVQIPGGPAKVTDNRITFRSATSLTTPGAVLQVSGADGTALATSGKVFDIVSTSPITLDGDTIDVPDPGFGGFATTFTYVNGIPQTGTEIQTSPSAGLVATRTKQVVETWFGTPNMFAVAGSTLTLNTPGVVSYTDSAFADGGIVFSGVLNNPAISIDAEMDANAVALAIRQGLADVYSGGDINNIKGYEDLIQIIGHGILDDGPLTSVSALPGDEFGAFNAGYVNSQAALRPGSLRGMNNTVEGVYIDDIIIGFAERGEMVTNAGAGLGFIANQDVDDTPPGPNRDVAEFNQSGDANQNLDILNGRYDVEIRRATDYGESQTADPTNVLYRTLDTNDREGRSMALTVPDATLIPDRTTFTVSNGINSVTFQFVDNRSATLAPDPGNFRILYSPVTGTAGTYQDNQELIARLIVNAINSPAAQDALSPANLIDAFGVQAMYSDTTGSTSKTIHLTGNASVTPDPVLASLMQITNFNATGDSNRAREQGQIIIQSSFVTDTSGFGILIDAGARTDGMPHPGSVRTTQEVNTQRLVPGVVITNNVIANNSSGGIRYSGDQATNPQGVAPVGRIVNNTIFGGGTGIGILVEQGASPTLMNNIVADLNVGISVTGGSSAVIGSTLYQSNGVNSNAGLGTFPIVLAANEPLFVDAASGNFYPAPASRAIDSSIESLADNPEIVRVKTPLGVGLSPLVAPELDVFGQVRGDDSTVATPTGQGGNVFLDRGAIDRVDFFAPTASMTNPEDGGADDLEPDPGIIWINEPESRREFRIRLLDQGIGIDDAKVRSEQFLLKQDGVELIDGVHYVWAYNSVNNDVIFTAVTSFDFERRYTIQIQNQPIDPGNPDSIEGVQDLAGNFIAANQTDNSTLFEILVTDGVNDPPINNVPTARQSLLEDSVLTFQLLTSNGISVSDADVHLSPDPQLNVTLTASIGTLTLADLNGLTFPTGDTGISETSITFRGTVTDLNIALEGLQYTPPADYFNLLAGEDPNTNPDPVEITITTDDSDNGTIPVGQFAGLNSPVETDTDIILVDVVSVNDAPTFNTPVADPPAVDEDAAGLQTVPNFVSGMSPGPASESAQTTAFAIQSVVVTEGNLSFLQGPDIAPNGTLTYELAPDANGKADITFVLQDFNAADVNHVSAVSAPETVELVVNPINDEPVFTLASLPVSNDEDTGPAGPFALVSSFAAGPATATDETAAPPAGQTPTFMSDAAPAVLTGNLVFTQFAVAANGDLTYEVAPNTSGTATFNMWLVDDGPTSHILDDNQTDPVAITITVNPVADPPVPVTPDYVIDEGDSLTLDASGSSDLDIGSGVAESLSYGWDLNNNGTIDVTGVNPTVPYATLQSLGLNVPGDNTIKLEVTDTFSGTTVGTTGTVTILTVDYGDAPDPDYITLKANGGPAHTIVSGFHLGATIDNETDASADDGADEDGIVFEAGMQADAAVDVGSFFTATASAPGKLDIWLDLNNDGTFDDPGEHLNGGVSYDLVAGANTFDFTILAGSAVTGVDTAARARFSSAGSLTPIGRANDGEVEDYILQISPLLDAVGVEHVLPMWSQTSDLTPLLQWRQVNGSPAGANATYNITLFNSLNQVVGFEENHTGTSIEISDPLPGGVYTVQVQSFNRAGIAGPVTTLNPFEVIPVMVTAPTGNIPDGLPTVTWTAVTDSTDHYELQIRSAISGATVIEELNLPGNLASYSVTNRLPLDDYEVRVRAIESTTNQPGDWSPFQTFQVQTAPTITAPTGTVNTGTPTIIWTSVAGAVTYDLRISDLTDDIVPIQLLTNISGTSVTLTTPLELGDYSLEVRGVTNQGDPGAWSAIVNVLVGVPTTVSQPTGRVQDSTPTVAWSAVPGAERYDVEILDAVTNQIVHQKTGITGIQYTVPNPSALSLGNYTIQVRANNLPAATSTSGIASVLSSQTAFTVSTPPVVTGPNVGIYDTTPTIDFTTPAGTVTSEVEIQNGSGVVVVSQTGVAGNQFTVPNNSALTPGQYRVRVRSTGNAGGTSVSDWSVPHFFQIGSAPTLLGPVTGVGAAPYSQTNDATPVLAWQGSVAGESYEVWISSISDGKAVQIVGNINSQSFQAMSLKNGQYRYWVRANNGVGELSAWSAQYNFQVTTGPVMAAIGPNFNDPLISWQPPANTPAADISHYDLWFTFIDVTPNQRFLVETNLTATEYMAQNPFPKGRYKVWSRAYVTGTNPNAPVVRSSWSNGVVFEISGRPVFDPIGETTDDTPELTWTSVAGAATYEVFVASASAPSTALIREVGLSTPSYQVTNPLSPGNYIAWARAKSTDGRTSPWSLTSRGRFSVNATSRPVVDQIPASSDQTPTITWSAVSGAVRYDVYIALRSNPNTALIRQETTNTFFTSSTALPPGQFRVWVRAINVNDEAGPWSIPVDFTIVSRDQKATDGQPVTMLASLEAVSPPLDPADVTVSLIPARVVEDSGRKISDVQTNFANVMTTERRQEEVVRPEVAPVAELDNDHADDLMSNWDDAIWAVESASDSDTAVPIAQPTTEVKEQASKGWLAGLAMLSPSLFRRSRKTDE